MIERVTRIMLSVLKFSFLLMMFLVLSSQTYVFAAFAEVTESEAASVLIRAEEAVVSGYQAVMGAENAGGNVSGLLVRLNDAGRLLAAARMSHRNGDFDTTNLLAKMGESIGEEVHRDAVWLRDGALTEGSQRRFLITVASVAGVVAVALGSFGIWHRLRKEYGEYRSWFVVGCLALMLVVATPASALYFHLPSGSESFSELWLLGSSHKAEDYPFNVRVNETYSIFVGVGNQLGYSAYYRVFTKLSNQIQLLPVNSNSTPSPLPPLYEYSFFVREGEVWERLLDFELLDIDRSNGLVSVNNLSINSIAFGVDSPTVWNTEKNGFYYQLFFELWLYNMASNSFRYHNRFVSLWLNMTV